MNQDQKTGIVRAIVAAFVPAIVAYLAGRGISVGEETVTPIMSLIVTIVISGLIGAWSFYIHRSPRIAAVALAGDPAYIVKAVAKLPEVKGIEIEPTPKGRELAAAVGSTPDAVVRVAKPPPTPPEDK